MLSKDDRSTKIDLLVPRAFPVDLSIAECQAFTPSPTSNAGES
jgi:hypothetical protein